MMHLLKLKWAGLLAVLCFAGNTAWAQDRIIGFIKTVEGSASVVSAEKSVAAHPGMPLEIGHTLKTGAYGSLGVLLKDNTSLAIGSNTEIVLNEFMYEPVDDKLKLGLDFIKGSLHYVSGVIARLKPEAISIKTPTGMIGVRGTQFVAKVAEPQE